MSSEQFKAASDGFRHIPVLYREVLEYLAVDTDRPMRVVDATLGNGGHSCLILEKNRQAELLGIDRDGDALIRAGEKLAFAAGRIRLVRGKFSDLADLSAEAGWVSADAVLLDIGISSPQIDDSQRGFSIRLDGPLDMRMDQRSSNTASRVLNHESAQALERIFREYGECDKSWKMAKAVVERRATQPFTTTFDFARFCESVLGRSKPGRLPVSTLYFQALRIAVNDELEELRKALPAAMDLLKPGGRLAVITFHSLEDRIVKNFFRETARECICPPGLPVCMCKHHAGLKVLTRKPVTAQEDELKENSRAGSAKLRAAEKI
jgi:16S rRNA (cytosine1402-N4)-methyltransferase